MAQAESTWVPGSVPRWFTRPKTVTHPGTNQAQRRVTTLIESNALPLRHIGTCEDTIKIHWHLHLFHIITSACLSVLCDSAAASCYHTKRTHPRCWSTLNLFCRNVVNGRVPSSSSVSLLYGEQWRICVVRIDGLVLLLRNAMHKRGLCRHAVSVSVTFVNCVETNKHIVKIFSLSGRSLILVFPRQTA